MASADWFFGMVKRDVMVHRGDADTCTQSYGEKLSQDTYIYTFACLEGGFESLRLIAY